MGGGLIATIIHIQDKTTIGLYALDSSEIQAIRYLAGDDIKLVVYPEELRFTKKRIKDDLIVYHAWDDFPDLNMATLPDIIAARTVPSLRLSGASNEEFIAMPIFLDHFELATQKDRLVMLGDKEPRNLEELEALFRRWAALKASTSNLVEQNSWPMLFAGGDDKELLYLASALVASETGHTGYKELLSLIDSGADFNDILTSTLLNDETGTVYTLETVLSRLIKWKDNAWTHPEWYALTRKDVQAILESDGTLASAHTLSFRRKIDFNAISRFSSKPFPSSQNGSNRIILAPITVISCRTADQKTIEKILTITSPDKGKEAAQISGRAPTLSASAAPDIQAADTLALVASYRWTANGLFLDAFNDESEAASFAKKIRDYLRSN